MIVLLFFANSLFVYDFGKLFLYFVLYNVILSHKVCLIMKFLDSLEDII